MNPNLEEETFESGGLNTTLWKRVIGLMLQSKRRLKLSIILVAIMAGVGVIFPLLNGYAIDTFYNKPFEGYHLAVYAVVYAFSVFLQGYLTYQFIYQCGKIEMDVSYGTRQMAMEKLQNQSFSYFDTTPSGWIMARVTSDIGRLSEIISWSFIDLVWGLFTMVMFAIAMLIINFKLGLIVLTVVPVIYIMSSWFQKRILMNYRKTRAINSKITGALSEGISGAKTTKTMRLEKLNYSEFSTLTSELRSKSMRAVLLSSMYVPVVIFVSSLGNAGVIVFGGAEVLNGVLQIGTLIAFTQYVGQFLEPLRIISGNLASLQMAQASAERVLSMLDSDIKIVDTPEVIQKYGTILNPNESVYEPIVGNIEFKNVTFAYNENEIILKDFNLSVEPKQRIALVGETGSGKSTIVNLICRFYEPTSGSIEIDGVDIKERSIGWLHSHLGYVLQAPHLFDGTIKDNIKYGKLDATDEDVIEAAKLVDAHDFIMELEQGYDTPVGEGGNRLSTGQKQLISFARALIAKPSIFVLDEATSSIDTETEVVIQNAVEKVLKDHTSFIIAHRLSTIVNADRILVIRKGEIVEDGTHHELMEKNGYYATLYNNQYDEMQENLKFGQIS